MATSGHQSSTSSNDYALNMDNFEHQSTYSSQNDGKRSAAQIPSNEEFQFVQQSSIGGEFYSCLLIRKST